MTNPANIYILYGSKIVLRKNILKKNKGDKTMKKVLLTSAVALAAFSTVQAVSANSEVSTKKETTEFVNGIKVEKTETSNTLGNSSETVAKFFENRDKEAAAAKESLDAHASLPSYIDNTDNDITTDDLNEYEDFKAVLAERAKDQNHKFETLTVRDRDGKELLLHGKKIQVKNEAGSRTVELKTKNGTYKLTVLVYNNKAVVTRLPELVANAQKDGWVKENGSWFYLEKGVKATGWVKDNGTWYYLNAEGVMQTGWVKDNGTWYYLNGSGAMQTGWVKDNGTWYYLKSSGAMATGWYQVGGKWYYSYASGALAVNTTVDGYTVNGNGEWV